MDVSGIASLATAQSTAQTNQSIGISVLKMALDSEKSTAEQLLAAIPAAPSAQNLPAHLGQNINTVA
jgi:hypothetical protein